MSPDEFREGIETDEQSPGEWTAAYDASAWTQRPFVILMFDNMVRSDRAYPTEEEAVQSVMERAQVFGMVTE